MRILVHDYAGHPSQIQLSRELARRDHDVLHLYAGSIQTPRGSLTKQADDPEKFSVSGIFLKEPIEKQSFFKRFFQEYSYGILLAKEIREFSPNTIISGNAPLDVQSIAFRTSRRAGIKFVFWLQDVYGLAIYTLLRKRIPVLGALIGRYYIGVERRLLRECDAAILITEDFLPLLEEWGVESGKTFVIPNWGPLENLPLRPKNNVWTKGKGIANKFCFLYGGTLGMKHNPKHLLELANHFKDEDQVCVVVVSEGQGADWLKEQKALYNLKNLFVLDFQPFEQLPNVLGAADVLVAILEKEAGIFSVPSKILSYLCVRKPLLLAVPLENMAAKIVLSNKAGLAVNPEDKGALIAAAKELWKNPTQREGFAENGFLYAKENFNIQMITDKFENVLVGG